MVAVQASSEHSISFATRESDAEAAKKGEGERDRADEAVGATEAAEREEWWWGVPQLMAVGLVRCGVVLGSSAVEEEFFREIESGLIGGVDVIKSCSIIAAVGDGMRCEGATPQRQRLTTDHHDQP